MSARERQGRDAEVSSFDESQREAILGYTRIAASSGALLSLKDLAELLAVGASEEELRSSILSDPWVSARVALEADHLVLRPEGLEGRTAQQAAAEEQTRRARALANLEEARRFSRYFVRDSFFVAVAGTTSYLSAAASDDIDFFCVTRTDGMWAFMLKVLILSRVSSFVNRGAPPFCFSFVLDERQAREELGAPKTALYARDALTAKLISGDAAYHALIENATWMSSFFPAVYKRRLGEATSGQGPRPSSFRGSKTLNAFLLATLGSYVGLRAWVLNRKLTKEGKHDAVFKTRLGPGFLEYASRHYLELGKMYQALGKR